MNLCQKTVWWKWTRISSFLLKQKRVLRVLLNFIKSLTLLSSEIPSGIPSFPIVPIRVAVTTPGRISTIAQFGNPVRKGNTLCKSVYYIRKITPSIGTCIMKCEKACVNVFQDRYPRNAHKFYCPGDVLFAIRSGYETAMSIQASRRDKTTKPVVKDQIAPGIWRGNAVLMWSEKITTSPEIPKQMKHSNTLNVLPTKMDLIETDHVRLD